MTPDLSIVVPVYEEADSLPELAESIRDAMDGAGLTFEVWLVDDGSKDASWDVIERIHREDRRFAGVRFRRNYGQTAALQAGFDQARGDVIITLDGDLQNDPRDPDRNTGGEDD